MFLFDIIIFTDCCPDEFEDVEDEDDEEEEDDGDVEEDGEDECGDQTDPNESKSKYEQLIDFVESEGEDALFPPLDGTSFYLLTCKINHSCDPNVIVTYTATKEDGLQARLQVLKCIEPDKELVQSYIDQSQPVAARRAALVDYGFICSCSKCKAES
jgi:hypothetical protein